MNAAKHKLKAQGLKPSAFLPRELASLADTYLAQHKEELLTDAKATVEQWRRNGLFGKRCAAVASDAQLPTP